MNFFGKNVSRLRKKQHTQRAALANASAYWKRFGKGMIYLDFGNKAV